MKKFIFRVAIIAAFVLVAGFGVYNSQKEELALSDLMLDNVEALANGESGGSYDCCQNQNTCKGSFCGTFYPAGSLSGISVYHKS